MTGLDWEDTLLAERRHAQEALARTRRELRTVAGFCGDGPVRTHARDVLDAGVYGDTGDGMSEIWRETHRLIAVAEMVDHLHRAMVDVGPATAMFMRFGANARRAQAEFAAVDWPEATP